VGQAAALGQPIVPIQRYRLGSPLAFEAVRAAIHAGAAEVEATIATTYRLPQGLPIEQHVDSQTVVIAQRRCPGDFQALLPAEQDRGRHRSPMAADDDNE